MVVGLATHAFLRLARNPKYWAGLVLWALLWNLLARGAPAAIVVSGGLFSATFFEVVFLGAVFAGAFAPACLRGYEQPWVRTRPRTLFAATLVLSLLCAALLVMLACLALGHVPALAGSLLELPAALLPLPLAACLFALRLAPRTLAMVYGAAVLLLALGVGSPSTLSRAAECAAWSHALLPILGLGLAAIAICRDPAHLR